MKALAAKSLLDSRLLQRVAESVWRAGPPETPDTMSLEERLVAVLAETEVLRSLVRSLLAGALRARDDRLPCSASLLLVVLQPCCRPGLRCSGAGGGGPGRAAA